jgi:hypothetical protein
MGAWTKRMVTTRYDTLRELYVEEKKEKRRIEWKT